MPYVGSGLRRREDQRLLAGAGIFVDDLRCPDMLHMAVVRSPHAHARIRAIDPREAARMPGVVAVVTGRDLPSPIPRLPAAAMFPGVQAALHPLLADETVRYAGEPVAAVVAEDRYTARDAAERVRVEYEALPPVVDLVWALGPAAPVIHAAAGSNAIFTVETSGGDPEAAFRRADVVVPLELRQPRLAPAPLECRGIVASYDAARDRLEVWLSTQIPHEARQKIAEFLGVAADRVRVVAPDVGGGFGAKGAVYPDEMLVAYLAWRLRRRVKWVEDRFENFRAMTHGRGQRASLRAAVAHDGTVLAVDGDILADLGAYCLADAAVIPALTLRVALGAYRVEHVRLRLRGVATTQTPTGPYRGAGRPEGAYYIERLMDAVAARLGIDPAAIRRRNFIHAFPHRSPTGLVHDSGNYGPALDRALERVGYARWRDEQARRRRAGGPPIGIGISTWIEIAGGGDLWEDATVTLEPSGRVTVLTGTSPHGQGHETAFSQVAADGLGVDPEEVTVLHGDTDVVPTGIGTFASRSLAIGGSAVAQAADAVRRDVIAVASRLLEAAPDDLAIDGGRVAVRGAPGRALTLGQVARAARPDDARAGISAAVRFEATGTMVPSGAHVAVVEIDPDTGAITILQYVAVDDCGRVVNPLLVEGQVHGSLAQGIAQAVLERVACDANGQPLVSSFLDYAMPTASQVPRVETERLETRSPVNPLGSKGIGESGTTGAPPAIVNAVLDALRPAAAVVLDMPVTPEALWRAFRQRGTPTPPSA
jgi:carbon-monoxide dehydrogenase large subunit